MKANKKSKIPYFFFAFFATFITVDSVYIYLANKSWTGTLIQNPYQKGLNYNQTIQQSKKQKQLNWQIKTNIESLGNKTAILTINLSNSSLKTIKNAEITAKFKRPTQEGFDFTKKILFNNKNYSKTIKFPLKGQWKIELTIKKDNNIFKSSQKKIIY